MSLVIRDRGRTTTVKPRRPRPKPAGGKVTANPYVTDNKPRPKLGSKPSGKKFAAPGGSAPKSNRVKPNSGKKFAAPGGSAPKSNRVKPNSGKKFAAPGGSAPSRPSRVKASGKRGGARPMSSAPRRPRGRR